MSIPALNAQPARRTTKCGVCCQIGHNRRTCPVLRNPRPFPEPLQPDPTPTPTPPTPPTPLTSVPKSDDLSREDDVDECIICFEALDTSVNFVSTPCKHKFCFECMIKHLRNDSRCPMCRVDLIRSEPEPAPAPTPRRLPQPRPRRRRQTPATASRVRNHSWNNHLIVSLDDINVNIDGVDVIPLSQVVEPQDYEVILEQLSSVSLQEAQDIINRVFMNQAVF